MNLPRECGVYKLIINSEMYIGGTKNFRVRFNHHIHHLRKKTHYCPKLQEYFDRFGNPKFEIIELCEEDNLQEREQHYLKLLQPKLNSTLVVGNVMKDPKILNKLVGCNNYNCNYIEEQIEQAFFLLLESRKFEMISLKTGVKRDTLNNITAGKSHLWLKQKYPEKYCELELARGGTFTVKQILEVLKRLNKGETIKSIGERFNVHHAQISLIKYKRRNYFRRIYDNVSEAKMLWDTILNGG